VELRDSSKRDKWRLPNEGTKSLYQASSFQVFSALSLSKSKGEENA
jgi:hypothetical protein